MTTNTDQTDHAEIANQRIDEIVARTTKATLPEPYYQADGITIYHADCRDVLPMLGPFSLVATDPPFPNMEGRVSEYAQCSIDCLEQFSCRQFVFWHALGEFPLTFSGVHIWDKKTGTQSQYERIFDRNTDSKQLRVFNNYLVNSIVAASMTGDQFNEHPSQKPLRLMKALIALDDSSGVILDPWMGSGTTLRAAKDLGRQAVGIEVVERYCEIAAERLRQGVFDFSD